MLSYIAVLVGVPFAHVIVRGLSGGLGAFWTAVTAPIALHALVLTFWTAVLVSVVNAVMGTAIAWTLVRYRVPGRALLSATIDLPFALPTLVAGVMLVALFGPQAPGGKLLLSLGVQVAYAPLGILIALLFVTLPLVVRSVEPVLLDLDPAEEEAAMTLGAGPTLTFFWVTLRSLAPAISYGTLQTFARALAEFGAIVVVSGNMPFRTQTASVYVFAEVESGETQSAAAVSIVLLAVAMGLSYYTRMVQRRIALRA